MEINISARTLLTQMYLSWRNEFVSITTFAENNGLTDEQAQKLIDLGRDVFNSTHPDA